MIKIFAQLLLQTRLLLTIKELNCSPLESGVIWSLLLSSSDSSWGLVRDTGEDGGGGSARLRESPVTATSSEMVSQGYQGMRRWGKCREWGILSRPFPSNNHYDNFNECLLRTKEANNLLKNHQEDMTTTLINRWGNRGPEGDLPKGTERGRGRASTCLLPGAVLLPYFRAPLLWTAIYSRHLLLYAGLKKYSQQLIHDFHGFSFTLTAGVSQWKKTECYKH